MTGVDRITKDVESYISKCEFCQKNKLNQKTKMPLVLTDTPEKPFEKCALVWYSRADYEWRK